MRRILLTSINFYPYSFGGGPKYVLTLAHALRKKDYEVGIVTYLQNQWNNESVGEGNLSRYVYDGLEVQAISIGPTAITQGQKYAMNHPLLRSLVQTAVESFAPSILHTNGMEAASYMVAAKLGIPVITTVHHSGVACPAGALVYHDDSICPFAMHYSVCVPCCGYQRIPESRLAGYLLGSMPRWFYEPYGKWIDSIRGLPYLMRALHYPWLVEQEMTQSSALLGASTPLIVPSRAIQDLLRRNGVPPGRINLIPHGVDHFQRVPLPDLGQRPLKFGFVGQIERIKGIHVLFAALEKIRTPEACELHLYGDGTRSDFYCSLLERYKGRVKVFAHGLVGVNQLEAAYANIDVLVVPSLAHEAFGLVVNEALAVGRPVIVSDSGALPELVVHGKYGLVVKRNNISALADAMNNCVEHPDYVHDMAAEIPAIKGADEYATEIEELYRSLLDPTHAAATIHEA